MGAIRNGARTFLNIMSKGCKLSRMNGFRLGVTEILGPTQAEALFTLWDPLCVFIDLLVAGDNYYNQIDAAPDHTGDEDDLGGI